MTDAASISSRGVCARRRARAVRDVGVAGGVDDAAREDRLASRLGLGHDPGDRVAVEHRRDEGAMEHRMDPRLLDETVGDDLEPLGVELVRQRLALGHGGAHRVRTLLEFAGDAAGVDRLLVPVPRHPLDADGGDVSAEAAEPLDQRDLDAGPGPGEGGGEARRAGADDEQLRLVHDVDVARGLVDRPEAATGCHQSSRIRTATSSSSFACPLKTPRVGGTSA